MRSCANRPVTPKDKLANELISIYMNHGSIYLSMFHNLFHGKELIIVWLNCIIAKYTASFIGIFHNDHYMKVHNISIFLAINFTMGYF